MCRLRASEWIRDDSDAPRLASFRMATAEIFEERRGEGSIVFLATVPNNIDTENSRSGRVRVAVGAAELSPVELKGVFINDGGGTSNDALGEAASSSLYVTDVVASSSHRRLGVGSRLMEAVESQARETGRRFLFLYVEYDNVGARRFYERLGYNDVDIKSIESVEGEGGGEESGIVHFSLVDGTFSTPYQTTRSKDVKNGEGLVAMDANRLAINAGTVGQLLMMKLLSAPKDGHARSHSFRIDTESRETNNAPTSTSSVARGRFGKVNAGRKRKRRKR